MAEPDEERAEDRRPVGAITPSAAHLPEADGSAFDTMGVARRLLRGSGQGTLATLDPASGYPLATLVTCAPAVNGAPLFFLSALSLHTRNLQADPRVSLLLMAGGKGDPLAHPRLSLVGRCLRDDDGTTKPRFLARHPKAMLYADLPDFAMWRLEIEAAHFNGGFARARMLTLGDLLCEPAVSDAFAAQQAPVLARLHHHALADIARLLSADPQYVTLLAVDADGLDLTLGGQGRRLAFSRRLNAPDEVMDTVSQMAGNARSPAP